MTCGYQLSTNLTALKVRNGHCEKKCIKTVSSAVKLSLIPDSSLALMRRALLRAGSSVQTARISLPEYNFLPSFGTQFFLRDHKFSVQPLSTQSQGCVLFSYIILLYTPIFSCLLSSLNLEFLDSCMSDSFIFPFWYPTVFGT